jgi:hypothetical protein
MSFKFSLELSILWEILIEKVDYSKFELQSGWNHEKQEQSQRLNYF